MRFEAIRRLLARLQMPGSRPLDSDPGSYTDSELDFGRLVLPLLQDMDSMKRALDELEQRSRALETVLDRLPVPALVLDDDGRLLTVNRAARALFGGPAITSRILTAARSALEGTAETEVLSVPHPGKRGANLRFVSADVGDDGRTDDDDRPSVVFVVSDEAPPEVDTASLVGRFGLTRAESRVVAVVAQGATNKEAADRFSISIETVRSHINAAFRKTGARNRASLVALAFGARFGQGPISSGTLASIRDGVDAEPAGSVNGRSRREPGPGSPDRG